MEGRFFKDNLSVLGSVGIGTTSPSQKLHVSGNSLVTGYTYIGDANRYFTTGQQGHAQAQDPPLLLRTRVDRSV